MSSETQVQRPPAAPDSGEQDNMSPAPQFGEQIHTPALDLTSTSPLWMITTEPILNELVTNLQQFRLELLEQPAPHRELQFSKTYLEQVRVAFAHMIRLGEESLHRLCQLLCHTFITTYQLQSVVIGEIETTGERFRLVQDISPADLYSTTDLDLGTRQLNKLRFFDGQNWSKASLVANVVDYQPIEPNLYGIHRLTSRIKAEEEIWNKVVDEIFDLDSIVTRDKQLRHLSRYVKDVFGLKIVVGRLEDVRRVHQVLLGLTWPDNILREYSVEPGDHTNHLEFIEVKDYMTPGQRKQSGWGAMKSVVRWAGKTFEIQIQLLRDFLHEREVLTQESHLSFKANREQVREQVARQLPLFRFYRDLLCWLFLAPETAPPVYPNVTLKLID